MTNKPAEREINEMPWGWQNAECHGRRALGLFIDDLDRVLRTRNDPGRENRSDLTHIQTDVDELLSRYVQIGAAPEIFAGQSVRVEIGVDNAGKSHWFPIFSPSLKALFKQMLKDSAI